MGPGSPVDCVDVLHVCRRLAEGLPHQRRWIVHHKGRQTVGQVPEPLAADKIACRRARETAQEMDTMEH
eukprot:5207679-Amphidinium_carterae.1